MNSVLEWIPDAVLIADASGRVVFANGRSASLFGYGPQELLTRTLDDLLPERLRNHGVHFPPQYMTESSSIRSAMDLHALRRDGSEFPVELNLSPIPDSQRLTLVVVRDVTEQRRTESELIAAREAANRADLAKSRFLATASHDLRQPLQALSLLNGTLRRMVPDRDTLEALTHQEQAINAMSRLVNALLDISKLESGKVRPELTDFPVTALLEELRQEFEGLAAHKGLALEVSSTSDTAHSDPALVGQILRNLLSNAIKYTRRGLVLMRSRPTPSGCRIEVIDTGIGIPAEQIGSIYDEFFQIGGRPGESREGYGLGLSIVNRLVRLLNLKLTVQSEPGKGSSFSFELPAGAMRVELGNYPMSPGSRRPSCRTRHRILLVEDDEGVRDATRMLLKAEGHEVITATCYREALQKAPANAELDLLITDYHLAGSETGVEVLESLRARRGGALKTILMSGDTSPAVKGLTDREYLRVASKPIKAEQLLAIISELLPAPPGSSTESGCAPPGEVVSPQPTHPHPTRPA